MQIKTSSQSVLQIPLLASALNWSAVKSGNGARGRARLEPWVVGSSLPALDSNPTNSN